MNIQKFEFNMFPVNSYVLWDDTKEAVVVDPGVFFDTEKEQLKKFIADNGLKIKHLLNTHLHLDHILGNTFMFQEYGIKAEASQDDEYWLEGVAQQGRMFGFEVNDEPVPLGKYLKEGDQIQFGNQTLDIFQVPGHSPGSLVFYNQATGDAFSGDVLFQGSVGRADLQGGNFTALKENIIKKLFILPDETVVHAGHGPSTTIGREKKYNPFFTDVTTH